MDRSHNSETCPDPKKGHKSEATTHNNMGGSQEVSFKRKKVPEGEKSPKK
jgi:hypothetical protein